MSLAVRAQLWVFGESPCLALQAREWTEKDWRNPQGRSLEKAVKPVLVQGGYVFQILAENPTSSRLVRSPDVRRVIQSHFQ